jgi:hypothetical protein
LSKTAQSLNLSATLDKAQAPNAVMVLNSRVVIDLAAKVTTLGLLGQD